MDELLKQVIRILKEEHQDWVKHIKDAEENDTGVDLNLSGNFAERINSVITAFREYLKRGKPKKGLW